MRRLIAVVLCAALLFVAALAASNEAPIATAAACGGTVSEQINGRTIRARSIATRATSCTNGRRVLRVAGGQVRDVEGMTE